MNHVYTINGRPCGFNIPDPGINLLPMSDWTIAPKSVSNNTITVTNNNNNNNTLNIYGVGS